MSSLDLANATQGFVEQGGDYSGQGHTLAILEDKTIGVESLNNPVKDIKPLESITPFEKFRGTCYLIASFKLDRRETVMLD